MQEKFNIKNYINELKNTEIIFDRKIDYGNGIKSLEKDIYFYDKDEACHIKKGKLSIELFGKNLKFLKKIETSIFIDWFAIRDDGEGIIMYFLNPNTNKTDCYYGKLKSDRER